MPRYFLEVAYKGTAYSGFQIQKNSSSIQGEVEKALFVLFGTGINLTCSSRTDAGVHAQQNFFHFDFEKEINKKKVYNLNAVLPKDILIRNIHRVADEAHCRFDAESRKYKYFIYQQKDPFLYETTYYYPFRLDIKLLNEAAKIIMNYNDFTSFSKKKTQVKSFECDILQSEWVVHNNCIVYNVVANRFLRGMVKALVGTMLKVGRKIISVEEFQFIIESKDCRNADFSPLSKGLFLMEVKYPQHIFTANKYI